MTTELMDLNQTQNQLVNSSVPKFPFVHSNIKNITQSQVFSSEELVRGLKYCSFHPDNKLEYIRMHDYALICASCVLADSKSPYQAIQVIKEKCEIQLHQIKCLQAKRKEEEISATARLKNQMEEWLKGVKEAFEDLRREVDQAENILLEKNELFAAKDLTYLDYLKNEILLLEEECDNRTLNLHNLETENDFIKDSFGEIPIKSSILKKYEANIEKNFENNRNEQEKTMREGLSQIKNSLKQLVSTELNEYDYIQRSNDLLKDKLDVINMKNFVLFKKNEDDLLMTLTNPGNFINSQDGFLEAFDNCGSFNFELVNYHGAKTSFKLNQIDTTSALDLILQELTKVKLLTFKTSLQSIYEEPEDLLSLINYQYTNPNQIRKKVEIDLSIHSFMGDSDPMLLMSKFIQGCRNIEELCLFLKLEIFSEEATEDLHFDCSETKDDKLDKLFTVIKKMKSSWELKLSRKNQSASGLCAVFLFSQDPNRILEVYIEKCKTKQQVKELLKRID